ncbi:UDP-N-acetylmuramate dehydrogenase [Alphaproteobacteria bacterium]|nr:UDP-N-acetylmuramate dehydrogenase [Alphaproteobacteria bacterium]
MLSDIKKIDPLLKSKFYYNFDMSKKVWFQAGGKALIYCVVYDETEFEIILNNIGNLDYEVIGAGSNILIRDKGFNGIILKLGKNFNYIKINEESLSVGAGILDNTLSKFAKKHNIKNYEFFSGIPGSVGGAIKMNAGCYGAETKNILINVQTINKKGKIKFISKEKLNMTYRKSSLPSGDVIIGAFFKLEYGDINEINKKIIEIKNKRENSQPLKLKTSGSTFKNPYNNYAAKLIETSDCKGLSIGGACVSNKHANFLINNNNATAQNIEDLGKKIQERVLKKFNISLEWEVKIIGNKNA